MGGAEGIRTPDPLHAMEVRYQLRHSPAAGYRRQAPALRLAESTPGRTGGSNSTPAL